MSFESNADIATGTGFSVADGQHYVTNHHVIEGAATLCLRAKNGELHPARVVNFDESDDLAILSSDYLSPPLILGS